MKLQQFLNDTPDLRVAPAGSPGSAGMETMYYGPATAAAVSKMQVMFRAEVLTPNGLVNPTGYFGASSRAKANDLCVTPVTTPTPEEGDEDGMEDEDEESAFELSGDGFLDDVQTDDEEDEVGEGEEDVVVAMHTLEADGGDIEVARMTFDLNFTGSSTVADDEAWDVFETFALWVDGDMIAEMDASDEDDYLSDDQQTVRFTNLGLVIEEGEEVEVLFAVSAQNSVDGAEEELANWNVGFIEARVFDADGVASNETTVGEMSAVDNDGNATTNLVDFEVVEEGTDDGADINGSSNSPVDATEVVDDGNDDSDEFVVHVFDIEVDNDSGDLEVGDAYVDVTMSNPAANADVGGQDDVLDEIFMTIDGVTVEGEATTLGTDNEDDVIASSSNTVVRYLFEFDQNVVLEGDEDYEVEVSMVFKGQDNGSNYENGVEVVTDVTGSQWEVEGSANDDELDGSDPSETLTLSAADVDVTNYGWTSPDAGTFLDFKFTVEANEEDYDVLLADFAYATSGTATTTGPVLSRTAGDATENVAGSDYTVKNGDTATFRIRWNLNGANGDTFDVTATSIAGRTIPDDEEVSPTVIRNVNN